MHPPPLPRAHVLVLLHPHPPFCSLGFPLCRPVWSHVQTGCRFPTVDLSKTGFDHFEVDIFAVQQEDLTKGASVPVSSIGLHIDGLVQHQTGKVLG